MAELLYNPELGTWFEGLYERYQHRTYVHPDPVEFLYEYDDIGEREIVAFLASVLAYGRVEQILNSVRKALDIIGSSPLTYVTERQNGRMQRDFYGFRHRFTTGAQLAVLLSGLGNIIKTHGSIGASFSSHLRDEEDSVKGAMERFVNELAVITGSKQLFLLPSPVDGSACKRFCLMLRWMVRKDEVDPGGWNDIPAKKLLIPLDTHMFREAGRLGFTERKTADFKAVIEVTKAFKIYRPEDPVRYDFSLTRLGIIPAVERKGARR